MAALWRGVPVLLLTCALTQVRSQVFVTERRQKGVSRYSLLKELDAKREEADPLRHTALEDDSSTAGASHSRPQAGRSGPAADQALLGRIAKLELLDAKLSKMDVLEKVFHFVQLDSNMARISTQVDRLAERLHERAPAICASTDSEVIKQLATLGGRLSGVEKMMEGVTTNVKNQLDRLDSQLGRLHSQLDAILERNVQLNTKTEIMREAVTQLLLASEVVDDQLEQADHNLGYLRDELDLVKQKAHGIYHQQHRSEEAIKEVTLAAQQKIDDQVQHVEKTLQQRLNLMTIDLSLISSTIWRAENETRIQHTAEPPDYLDDVLTSPLVDATFRAKFVNEIRSAVLEDSKRIIGSGCRRKESHSPEILKTRLVQDVQSAINSSLERIVAAQWMPSDCSDVHRQSTESGLFSIYPNACSRGHKMQVYCDMDTTGGGWTVIQRRGEYPGRRSINFYNDWNTYKWGFGNLSQEFYLGNELIHLLTSSDDFVLRVELEDFSGDRRYAEYQHFSIDGDTEQYRLNVGQYSGNAGDAMTYHNGLGFTTRDEEHDTWPGKNCATHYRGGWWFGACHKVNLNGAYLSGSHGSYGNGIIWYPWRGYYYSLRSTRMMVRPRRVHEMSPTMRP